MASLQRIIIKKYFFLEEKSEKKVKKKLSNRRVGVISGLGGIFSIPHTHELIREEDRCFREDRSWVVINRVGVLRSLFGGWTRTGVLRAPSRPPCPPFLPAVIYAAGPFCSRGVRGVVRFTDAIRPRQLVIYGAFTPKPCRAGYQTAANSGP